MRSANELRVFISSTFRDLQEEREHLVKKIFPEIRALCRERGITFTEVDLRWGLTEEEATLGRTIRTCLEEVDKCRPYFIGMIGNRYGWVPQLHEILMDPDLLYKYPFVEELAMQGASLTEIEFFHGVFDTPDLPASSAFFYRRTSHDIGDREEERLIALIDRARSSGYPFRDFTDLESLGTMVRDDLLRMIETHWPANQTPTELELERRSHGAFAASRIRAYIPDPSHLTLFTRWMQRGVAPLVVEGESGLGKSSLTAWLADYHRRRNPQALVIEHFVGASRTSGSALAIMRHVIEEIRDHFAIPDTLPADERGIERSFPNWLFRCEHMAAQAGIDVLIVIDAVNQLDEAGRRLVWLPDTLPPGIRVLISTTPEDTGSLLAEREWDRLSVLPVEDESFRQSIIVRYLGEFHKGISLDQLHRVIHDTKARSPLYLRVVAEELRLHGEHETIDALIDRFVSADDLLGLFQIMLERLEHDYGAADVRDLLGTIWASRTGLSENELMEITGMSRLQMSRLLFALDYHLLVRNGLLGFFHDYLRRAVETRYLSDPDERNTRHRALAEYFADAERSSRATLELLHALDALNRKEELITVLGDIDRLVQVWKSDRFEVLRFLSTTETSVIASACQGGLREWEEGGRSDQERVDAYATVGDFYNRVGLLADAKRAQLILIGILKGMGDRAGESSALSVLAEFSRRLGHIEEAGEYAAEAEAIGRELNDPALIAGAIGIQGIILSLQSRYDEALQCYVLWERFARERGDLAGVSRALGGRGAVHADRGDHDQALACYDECERIARDNGDLQGLSIVIGNRGNVYANRGEYELALECFDQHEKLARTLGNRASIAIAIGNRGSVLRKLGREDEALECYRTWERMARETGDLVSLAGAVGNRGTVHSARGENAEALACYQEQAELSRQIGNRDSVGIAMGNSGKVYADLNDPVQALKLYYQAASEHRATGYRFGLTYWLNGIADVMLAVVDANGDADLTEMPTYLSDYIPDEESSDWRKGALRIARDCVEEAIPISRDILKSDTYNAGRILRARINAMEGNVDDGIAELKSLMEEAGHIELRAVIHFWLWKLGDTDSDHREEALGLYRSLNHTGERIKYQKRIEELERTPDPST